MNAGSADWLRSGQGRRPKLGWSFATDAPLVDAALARETGDTLAVDSSGGIYLLDRAGRIVHLTRTAHPLRAVAFSDAGDAGAGLVEGTRLCWFDRRLHYQWTIELPDEALGLALDPYGYHVAVSLADGWNFIYDADQTQVAAFETIRPLHYLQFLTNAPALIAAAEYGLICRYQLDGTPEWSEKQWSNVGSIAATGDGKCLYVAGFMHGVQLFNAQGSGRGSWIVDGTPALVGTTFAAGRVVTATLERQLYSLDADGELRWGLVAPDDLVSLFIGPLGDWMICGFASGRVVRLDERRDR